MEMRIFVKLLRVGNREAIAGSTRCSITRQQFSSRDPSGIGGRGRGRTISCTVNERLDFFFCFEPDPSTDRPIGTAVFCVGVWKPVILPIATSTLGVPSCIWSSDVSVNPLRLRHDIVSYEERVLSKQHNYASSVMLTDLDWTLFEYILDAYNRL